MTLPFKIDEMKKIQLILCLFLLSISAFAQSKAEENLLNTMGDEACTAINKTDFSKRDDPTETKMKLGLAILPVLEKHREEIKKIWGLNVSESGDARIVAEKLGVKIAYTCPKVQEITIALLKKDEGLSERVKEKMNEGPEKTYSTQEVAGSILRMEGSDIATIFVQTSNDETMKILWLEQIEGSELLEKYSEADHGKTYTFTYKLMTVYQPKNKSYQDVKVLVSISKMP
jgi:hypothetical protein